MASASDSAYLSSEREEHLLSTLQINAEVRKRVDGVPAVQFRRARDILGRGGVTSSGWRPNCTGDGPSLRTRSGWWSSCSRGWRS